MARTKIISYVNNKGGVTKTFSTMQTGAILSEMYPQKRILMIDLDPQGNLSNNFGMKDMNTLSVAEVILGKVDINAAIKQTYRENLHLLTSDSRLKEARRSIENDDRRSDNRLLKALRPILQDEAYDYILIDNQPDISTLMVNSLTASDFVVIPVEVDVNSLDGFSEIVKMINDVIEDSNPKLKNLGIFIVKVEAFTNLHKQYIAQTKENFDVFDTYISKGVVASESLFANQALIDYDRKHKITKAYIQLVKELVEKTEK